MRHIGSFALIAVLGACSFLNRQGPRATCQDLRNGATNACNDGIVAMCIGSRVEFRVCDLSSACEQRWQTKGAYRCSEADPVAKGAGDDGGSPIGTNPTGDAGECGVGIPCVVASVGAFDIAIDDLNIYASDCFGVKRVPKTGGAITPVATGLNGCAARGLSVDSTDVYVQDGPINVSRVPKVGGSFSKTLPPSSDVWLFAVDTASVYWAGGPVNVLKMIPKAGRAPTTLTTNTDFLPGRMQIEGSFVYWLGSGNNLSRVATNVPIPTAPSSIALGQSASDFVVDGDNVYFTVQGGSSQPGGVWQKALSGGAPTEIASGLIGVLAVAIDATTVYFATHKSIGKIPRTGGPATTVVSVEAPIEGRIVVDERSVYWAASGQLMRVNK